MKNKTVNKPLQTIKDFLGDEVRMNEINYGGVVFCTSTNGESSKLANIPGFLGNISRHIGENKYDYDDISNFKLELTRYLTDAINEKIERDSKS